LWRGLSIACVWWYGHGSALGEAAVFDAAPPPVGSQVRDWSEARAWLRRNPEVRQAVSAYARARAGADEAEARLLPQLALQAGVHYSVVRPVFNSADTLAREAWFDPWSFTPSAEIAAAWTLSAASWRERDRAAIAAAAQREALAATQHGLDEALAIALMGVVANERLAVQARAGWRAADARLQLARRMQELGRATALDTQRFVQDLHAASAAVIAHDEALAAARDALGVLLGRGEPVGVAPSFPIDALDDGTAPACDALPDLSERADLREAKLRRRAAEASERRARAAYLPELRVETGYTADYASRTAITERGSRGVLHDWSVLANVTWSAFDGGARAARMDAAAAERTAAEAAADAAWQRVRADASRLQRWVKLGDERLQLAHETLDTARLTDELARKAFELGKSTALEVVDAASKLRSAELEVEVRTVELSLVRLRRRLLSSHCH
jgi:outer membrane protein TolC